jgi:hypothetical protein
MHLEALRVLGLAPITEIWGEVQAARTGNEMKSFVDRIFFFNLPTRHLLIRWLIPNVRDVIAGEIIEGGLR